MFNNKKSRQIRTVWTCPICGHTAETNDPRIVTMQCSTCYSFDKVVWMEWNDGGKKEEK